MRQKRFTCKRIQIRIKNTMWLPRGSCNGLRRHELTRDRTKEVNSHQKKRALRFRPDPAGLERGPDYPAQDERGMTVHAKEYMLDKCSHPSTQMCSNDTPVELER
jgi:hypothetical protein